MALFRSVSSQFGAVSSVAVFGGDFALGTVGDKTETQCGIRLFRTRTNTLYFCWPIAFKGRLKRREERECVW